VLKEAKVVLFWG